MVMCFGRARFVSMWSGLATIIFFAGVFIDYELFGYSGVMVGFFMWIIGGSIAGLIYGPRKSRRRDRSARRSRTANSYDIQSKDSQFCIACGNKYSKNTKFCPSCGTASVTANQDSGINK